MPNTTTPRSWVLHKNVYYTQHVKWPPMDHPYHHDTSSFEGIQEEGETPKRMTIDEIFNVTDMLPRSLIDSNVSLR
jgi:hypothetical protein